MSDKVYIRRFNPMSDLEELNGWLKKHHHPEAEMKDIAGIGYIALEERKNDDDLPIACAFLRRCEGGFGMLDGLATNPDASSALRHVGIDMVVEKIIQRAKSYKISSLLSWSLDKGTLERGLRHGFKPSHYTFIVKSLSD